MIFVTLVVLGLAAAAFVLVRFFPGALPWLYRALTAKDRLVQAGILLFALVAVWTGYIWLMLVGAAILLVAFVVFFDQYSLRDIRRFLGL